MVSLQRGFAQTARRSPASPVPGIHRSRPRAGARARGAGHTEQTTNRTQNNKHHVHHIIQSSFHPKGGSSGPHRSQSSRRRERISTRHNDEGPSKSEAALLFGHTTGFVAVCSRGACIIRAAVTRWPARRLLFGGSRAYSSVLVAVRSHVDNRGMLYYAPRRSGALESLHTRLSQPLQNGAFRNAYIPARAPPLQRGSLAAHRSHTTFPVLLSSHAHTLRSMPPSGLLPRKTTNVALCSATSTHLLVLYEAECFVEELTFHQAAV